MIKFRFARGEDSTSIANLLSELGYQADEKIISKRLFKIKERDGQVIVAENQNELLGCVHVFIDLRLTEGEVGEIVSLVVKSESRGQGIGKQLMDEAKRWLKDNNCTKIRIRVNSIRERAHQFYKRQGFDEIKSQKVLLLQTEKK